MPNIKTPKTVAGRIRLYSAIMVCLPLLITTIILILFVRSAIIEDGQKALLEQAQSHKIFIEEWFHERKNSVKFLATLESVRQGNLELSQKIFLDFDRIHTDISGVVMVGPHGKTMADSIGNILVDVSDREYFIKARNGEPHVTRVIIGRTSGKPIIIFSHPITRPDGSFGGLVFVASRLTAINNLMNNLRFGSTGETYILNQDGYMLTESRFKDQLKTEGRIETTAIMTVKMNSNVLQAGMAGGQPQGPYTDYRGVEVLGAGQWTKGGSWLIVSEINYREAMGQLSPFLMTLLAAFFVTMLLLIPVLFRLARSISIPLLRLSAATDKMIQGNFNQAADKIDLEYAPQEVEHLVDAFYTMQEKVDRTVQKLEKAAVTDQLTGLPNRRYLMKEGARLVKISLRANQCITLFMMDIDHFKKINDIHGHMVGDTVLRQVGEVVRSIARTSDIVARYGGEEFALVAPGANIKSAQVLAERIRQGIAEHTFNTDRHPMACTISIGIASCSSNIRFGADAYEDMLARADKALYAAKKSGRNTVVPSSEEAG